MVVEVAIYGWMRSCELDLGYNGKIAACWMGSTGPMVVSKVVHTDFKLFGLPRYEIAATIAGNRVQCDNPNHKLFLTEPFYFGTQKRTYKDEPVSFVALSGCPSETQFIMSP